MSRIGRHVRVTGLVQGVFFRAWAQEEARRLGVTGWVRNCPDGSVEALVEGTEDAVGQMIDLLRQGPSHARIDKLEVKDTSPEGVDRFEIRH